MISLGIKTQVDEGGIKTHKCSRYVDIHGVGGRIGLLISSRK